MHAKTKNEYINKVMFLNHPLYDYIYPIFNTPELETVLCKSGIMPKRISSDQKGSYYLQTFPINQEPYSLDSLNEIKSLMQKIQKVKDSNMDEFIKFCLDILS